MKQGQDKLSVTSSQKQYTSYCKQMLELMGEPFEIQEMKEGKQAILKPLKSCVA